MKPLTRRSLLFAAGAVVGAGGYGWFAREKVPFGEPYPASRPGGSDTILNDASLLNPTPVARHLTIGDDPAKALEELLRTELASARQEDRPFVVSAARHSMGGQSLARNGTVITLDQQWLEPDTSSGTFRVAAGMRWSDVIARLDPIGYSPKVMQSNNDFGVAATFCVNAHGWPVPWSAFGSTVRSIRMMRPDGEMIDCSRRQNTDEFDAAMGGYGLTGAITELEVEMVPNRRLQPKFEIMPAREFGTPFRGGA